MSANESLRTLSTLLTFLLLCRCGPDRKADPIEERASIVLLRETSDPSDPENPDAISREIVCGGCVVAPRQAVTAAHCLSGQQTILTVDHDQWWNTGHGFSTARLLSISGETAWLLLDHDPPAVAPLLPYAEGDATLVRRFESTSIYAGADMHVAAQLEHGDSGSCLFRGGSVFGIVQACDSDDGVTCLPSGGRVSEVQQ